MNSMLVFLVLMRGYLVGGQSIKKASVDERSKDISCFPRSSNEAATNLSIEENMAIAYRRVRNVAF
ncbi:MAG: hypothetical protein ACLTZB_02555 [Streptococcus salivarius]